MCRPERSKDDTGRDKDKNKDNNKAKPKRQRYKEAHRQRQKTKTGTKTKTTTMTILATHPQQTSLAINLQATWQITPIVDQTIHPLIPAHLNIVTVMMMTAMVKSMKMPLLMC